MMKLSILFLTIMLLPFSLWSQEADTETTGDLEKEYHSTRIVKTGFFSPLKGNFTLAYEMQRKPGITYTAVVGVPGVGLTLTRDNVIGLFVKGGVRLYPGKDYR